MAVGARGVRFWPRMGRHVFEEEKKEAAQVVDDLLKTATRKRLMDSPNDVDQAGFPPGLSLCHGSAPDGQVIPDRPDPAPPYTVGGRWGTRTPDPMRVKHVLYQLS